MTVANSFAHFTGKRKQMGKRTKKKKVKPKRKHINRYEQNIKRPFRKEQ